MINWKTERRKISELKGWNKNPRKIKADKLDELSRSIEELGNFEPLVINLDNTVISGNQRLKIYQRQGIQEVDAYVPDRQLEEKEVKKIGLLANRHSGEFDLEMLQLEFEEELKELGFDDLLAEDIDFGGIRGTEDRERKFKDMDVTCPHCGETFKIEV